ncbi:hypothetical protein [Sulfurimonas autotrophica]|uniref:Uncharacterized protein n=1 Tax=Sulfurimonas autotrophica (strain ATCC BAA-671 / DSM 16294 / JCM 11897 / OK10) TaxID=563040 RepID=E0UT92_SULAO|nr:hypothetical protein [Sulfurimonas autotrophica]ADN08195.1 conserved hypothetical protein [Sulfurimonas autotrophica DSM 16294]
MWIKQLKIALVQQDLKQVNDLLDNIPLFKKKQEMLEASCLLKEAANIFTILKNETALSMKQIQKNKDFLNSTQADATAKFDITS